MPIMHNVPIGFGNIGFIVVDQEEWTYQTGNNKSDLKYSDCFSWKELSDLAIECPHKCLPVVAQSGYEDLVDVPKCHNGHDHHCMFWFGFLVSTYVFFTIKIVTI